MPKNLSIPVKISFISCSQASFFRQKSCLKYQLGYSAFTAVVLCSITPWLIWKCHVTTAIIRRWNCHDNFFGIKYRFSADWLTYPGTSYFIPSENFPRDTRLREILYKDIYIDQGYICVKFKMHLFLLSNNILSFDLSYFIFNKIFLSHKSRPLLFCSNVI